MLNRFLSLMVAIVAPLSALAMLVAGAHATAPVSLAERAPGLGLALLALVLSVAHMRAARAGAAAHPAAMWWGVSAFLVISALVAPQLGRVSAFAVLALAAMSLVALASAPRRTRLAAA